MAFLRRYSFQVAGAALAATYLLVAIARSTSSTSAVGLLFLPAYALFGAFLGDALRYGLDVLSKRRPHSVGKSALIALVLALCAYQAIQSQARKSEVRRAGDPATPVSALNELLVRGDAEITRTAAMNPSLPKEDLGRVIDRHLTDYDVMGGAVRHPGLSAEDMERVTALERQDFKGDVEYRLYQTYVWAQLARRKDFPAELAHRLAAKKSPEHFLVLALLDSPHIECREKQGFLPQKNAVLESAIHRSMQAQGCEAGR